MADTITFANGNPLIYATCGGLVMETHSKNCDIVWSGATPAVLQGRFTSTMTQTGVTGTLAIAHVITMHSDTDDDSEPAVIYGWPWEIETQPIEVPAYDYSGLGALRFKAIGYIR